MSTLPETMKALQLVAYGSSKEALFYNEEVPMPQIKNPTEVLVRIKASGLHSSEAKARAGNVKLVTSFRSLPWVLGTDYAGTIVKKGDQVTEYEVGDAVFGSLKIPFGRSGTYAQYAVVDTQSDSIAKKPSDLSFEQAASSGSTALTAYKGIIKTGGYDVDDKSTVRKILVIGASGGVGSYGVQIAKAIGAETLGICSGKNAEFVKELGADRIIDYTQPEQITNLLEQEAATFDMIFDCVGGDDYYFQLSPLLKSKTGVYSTAVGPLKYGGSDAMTLYSVASMMCTYTYRAFFAPCRYVFFFGLVPNAEFHVIAKWFETKQLRGTVRGESSIFALQDGGDAHEQLVSNRTVGKLVLRID
ncbi:hypothetical protein K7432_008212 [Basidiobolus ranarum]|uniref:Enoyl reductase (ER) domain-containing protein n=1 Tax=Basidiobolus ranarum TaxID=34480 RepID=A0ABR2VYY8_9FUNG